MTIDLESMAVEMPVVAGHPNRAEFRGVLTVIDVPSERAPAGSRGRRVVLTRGAAEAALPSLLGMALDYAPMFERHDVRRKVGVITSADVVGRNLEVGGYLYAKDFPEIVDEVAKVGRRPVRAQRSEWVRRDVMPQSEKFAVSEGKRLRASLAAAVEDIRSVWETREKNLEAQGLVQADGSQELGMSFEVTNVVVADLRSPIWTLLKVTFTGAAILRRDKAAYQGTWIELV